MSQFVGKITPQKYFINFLILDKTVDKARQKKRCCEFFYK